ncbi:phenylacetic acid degradation bifunctional protein PaaZ [Yunchengibacter salinarum]|uniref:phenylacetic acid degradation bifunctional protein PaaZ n=1 Tax=Yunchengibacter salinarum TaxID=3133399 RepID=UPI0035B686F7
MQLQSYALGQWHTSNEEGQSLKDATTGEVVATCSSAGLDFKAMADYARTTGGPNLATMTFHERSLMIKALALALNEHKEEFYELSYRTGATRSDTWIDVDGGIGTMFVYSSKGRIELPDETFLIDGELQQISRKGTFLGQHIMVPRTGVAVHINAFNFPVWGMLEKLAPTLLAGMPAIVKPASATAYLTEQVVRRMVESGHLPDGAVQLICGGTGDLLDQLGPQDIVSFTGSASTARKLQSHPRITEQSVPFIAECDSLNSSVLGPDATPDSPEFDLFIKEVVKEVTAKAGQKCTAIRRALVPDHLADDAEQALKDALGNIIVGDPRNEKVKMGALASRAQRDEVKDRIDELRSECRVVLDGMVETALEGADYACGAFVKPTLLRCDDALNARKVHSVEAFGPVVTLLGYKDLDEAVTIANMGEGSLVASIFAYDKDVVRKLVMGLGPWHGRLAVIDRDSGRENTGHGSPLPHLKHGGPGRAGGGEELGGISGMKHYMQRLAVQGSPDALTAVTNRWITGARENVLDRHPFRLNYDEIQVGDTLHTKERTVTLEDIEHFAHFTGDTFYAHMDQAAAEANPFFEGRVAHGYLLLSFAAGLFVDPAPGPVLANYGLDGLTFMQPVNPGDTMRVRLVCRDKKPRHGKDYGEVHWDVTIFNQNDETCANYILTTMNARAGTEHG